MKTYTGWELIKAIKDREIKKGTKIYVFFDGEEFDMNKSMKFYTKVGVWRSLHLWREEDGKEDEDIRLIDTEDLTDKIFCIIEEPEEIDIQAIEELKYNVIDTQDGKCFGSRAIGIKEIVDKINELIKTSKQIDNKLNNR